MAGKTWQQTRSDIAVLFFVKTSQFTIIFDEKLAKVGLLLCVVESDLQN